MQRIPLILMLVALAAVPACSTANRQSPAIELPAVPNPEKRLHVLRSRLHLSDEQTEAIRPILEDEYQKKVELRRKQAEDNTWEGKQEAEELEWSVIKRLAQHLDRDQMDEYCKLLDEEQKAQQQGGPGKGGPGGSGGPGGGGGGPGGGRSGGPGGGFPGSGGY